MSWMRSVVDAYVASCKAAKERYGYSLDGDVSAVRPWLALGGRPDATLMAWRNDNNRRITHVVNALERDEEPEVSKAYGDNILKLNLKDDGDDRRFAALLPEVVAFVRRARAADPNAIVYVHCKSGVNRAPSLAMALLISLDRATFVEALAAVRAARPSCADRTTGASEDAGAQTVPRWPGTARLCRTLPASIGCGNPSAPEANRWSPRTTSHSAPPLAFASR